MPFSGLLTSDLLHARDSKALKTGLFVPNPTLMA
jgi:hypothetical protein